ncbi:ATP-dependent endonuclease of the OLD family-like protein [Nitrosococcus halophilus Nc 4]|uniref:ATP-dependent endonuclease of the OLD family-like protein n=1 Tax=Nitrosococcus halophilus (strain Nc4) TaxID=472759 RepID=D5C4U8_NITHN|nr:AAA family ATPase [Nitrosococcus halophilus]ADE13371.1 ATP-dependent endonuclease of the OLD family-like protein [Nitrosococcus halophilus Nc 4]
MFLFEQRDSCVHTVGDSVSITCEFAELPHSLILDAGAETTLADEYLLTEAGTLKIRKIYDCSKPKPTVEVFVVAQHPTAKDVDSLLELKEKDPQKIVKELGLEVPLKGNPGMRKAIWNAELDLKLAETQIPITKLKGDSKCIWEQLESYLPLFALFQSDRRSQDSDGEVQNPMKAAVAAAIAEVKSEIEQIQLKIEEKAKTIAESTHEALKTIDSSLAKELKPQFTQPTPAKWVGLFSVNMTTDHGIPLNKRGSGIRRLVLVSFFKAEAERQLIATNRRNIIYAIEEPETAQHPNNQRVLIKAFKELTSEPGCQVLLTTHSPGFAAELPVDGIRFVTVHEGSPSIRAGVDVFGEIAATLGVVPDSRVKVLVCVEGPTDVAALKSLSHALHQQDPSIPNLSADSRVAFVVLGGSTLQHWVTQNYLRGLGRPEIHIYDSDVAKYGEFVAEVNSRTDGSWAVQTAKHEIESYLHSDAILDAFNLNIEVTDQPNEHGHATPKVFALAYSQVNGLDGVMGESKAKQKLADRAFPLMMADRLSERDPTGEVGDWFRRIAKML